MNVFEKGELPAYRKWERTLLEHNNARTSSKTDTAIESGRAWDPQ